MMRLLLINLLISSFWMNVSVVAGDDVPAPTWVTREINCVTSPGYPQKYPINSDRNITFSVPDGSIVITLEDIDVEYWLVNGKPACWVDYLKFYDANGKVVGFDTGSPFKDTPLGEERCHEDHFPKEVIIPTSTATVLFHSGQNKYSDNSQRGFKFCYKASTTCLTSPDFPNNYPDNSDTTYFLSVPEGQTIQITVEDFDIEAGAGDSCGSDYLLFTDGDGNKFDEKMCGDSYPRTFDLPTFNIPTSNASIRFHSNGSIRRKGFKLCYEPSKNCKENSPPISPHGGMATGPWFDSEINMFVKDFQCSDLYSMVGDGVFHCISGVWSEGAHICLSNKNCSLDLPILRNGMVNGSGRKSWDHGDKYVGKFSCNPGFTLMGEDVLTCVAGVWSSNFPICTSHSSRPLATSSSGKTTLTSHGGYRYQAYPNYYERHSDSIQFLSVPAGKSIQVTIEDFDVGYGKYGDCSYDYVEFTDGNGDKIGEKMCGSSLNETLMQFEIPTSTASVRFHSDVWPYNSKRGFKLSYQSN